MNLAVIQARMGSTRLPGKILKHLSGQPILWHVYNRVSKSKLVDKVLVATTNAAADDATEAFCKENGITVFRGDVDDVLDRFYQAVLPHKPDRIVRITADCPLIDPKVIDQVIEQLTSSVDYATNAIDRTYPDGLDVEVMTFAALAKAWNEAKLKSEREHVTPYIWKNPQIFKRSDVKLSRDLSGLRLTVDEPADFQLVEKIYDALSRKGDNIFHMEDVLEFLEKHPELININGHISANEGYQKSLNAD